MELLLQKRLIRSIRKRLKRIQQGISARNQALQLAHDAESIRQAAELLAINYHKLYTGISQLEVEDIHTNKPCILQLDPRLAPKEQVAKFFRLYKKRSVSPKYLLRAKNSLEDEYILWNKRLEKLLNTAYTDEELKEYIKDWGVSIFSQKRNANDKQHELRRFISDEGYIIIVGKNKKANHAITMHAKKDDYWMHVRDFPGAHVIIQNRGHTVSEKTIQQAACYAIYFSKARTQAFFSPIAVYITEKKNLVRYKGMSEGEVSIRAGQEKAFQLTKEDMRLFLNKIAST